MSHNKSKGVKKIHQSSQVDKNTNSILSVMDKLQNLSEGIQDISLKSSFEKRVLLINIFHTMHQAATIYHRLSTFPPSDPVEREYGKIAIDDFLAVFEDYTNIAKDIIQELKIKKGENYNGCN